MYAKFKRDVRGVRLEILIEAILKLRTTGPSSTISLEIFE